MYVIHLHTFLAVVDTTAKDPAGGSLIWESSLSETMCQNTCVGSFLVHPVQAEQTFIISRIYKYHMRDIQSTSNDRDCSILPPLLWILEFHGNLFIVDLD